MIKRFLLSAALMLSQPTMVLANGAHEEEVGIGAQLNELLPFEHFGEGHWVAFILSAILWLALLYTIYSLVQKYLMNKNK